MAYDLDPADRLRDLLVDHGEVTERKMFGGLAFLVRGHMVAVARGKGGLMVRADPAAAADVVASGRALYPEMGNRTMRGWLCVDSSAVKTAAQLQSWVDPALAYAATLPPKP